ncbi:hypothetical protein M0804_014032 [Polistes exclamans]|nr:hypothetical protein M0804_014034 [Polistes exclamans]KAI4475879.1 hypothetical protein M0804_014032 [Polistes exclamans]
MQQGAAMQGDEAMLSGTGPVGLQQPSAIRSTPPFRSSSIFLHFQNFNNNGPIIRKLRSRTAREKEVVGRVESATSMRSLKPKVHAHPGNDGPEPRPTPPLSASHGQSCVPNLQSSPNPYSQQQQQQQPTYLLPRLIIYLVLPR